MINPNSKNYGDLSTMMNSKIITEIKRKLTKMNKINLDLIKTIISNHIKIETKKIDINSKSSDFAQWDSLAQVNIILDIEKNTKKKIAASKIGDLTSVKSIIDYLNNN